MMRGFGSWAVVCALMMGVHPVRSQEARLHISADSVFVGQRFELSVAIEHASGSTVAFQEVPPGDPEAGPLLTIGDAELFSARRLPPRLDGIVRVDSTVYVAATFALENAVVGPFTVYLMVGGDTTIVRSNTATLPVRSVLPAEEAELQPPAPPSSFPNPLWAWVLLVASVLVASALLIWLWRRSRGREAFTKPRLPPYPEATRRLNALTVPERGPAIKPFYIELSDLLRTYLSRTLGTPALELTTRELMTALGSDDRVSEAALKNIRGTLRVADLVKFADMRPDDDANSVAFRKTQEAVELVEAVVHPPEDAVNEVGEKGQEPGIRNQEVGGNGREIGEPGAENGGLDQNDLPT